MQHQCFFAAQGLQGEAAFFAAQGLQGAAAFFAAQGLQAAFFAAQGFSALALQGAQAARADVMGTAMASGSAIPAPSKDFEILRIWNTP